VIRKLVRDLDMPVRTEICPTVRDPDGLALSSRNAYLSSAERAEAPRLHRVLRKIAEGAASPAQGMQELAAAGWKPDYVEIRRRADLAVSPDPADARVVLAAARLGATRLIDNLEF
jgi:pantoate--beta-alanine ligase